MRKWKRVSIIGGLVTMLLLASSSTAFAQEETEPDTGSVLLGYLSTTTTTTAPTTVVGGIILTVLLVTSDDVEEPEDVLETYLRDNAVALQHDLHVGGGHAVEDLARIFEIPDEEFGAFAQLLYENRADLVPLLDPHRLDRSAAREFAEFINGEMLSDSLEIGSPG